MFKLKNINLQLLIAVWSTRHIENILIKEWILTCTSDIIHSFTQIQTTDVLFISYKLIWVKSMSTNCRRQGLHPCIHELVCIIRSYMMDYIYTLLSLRYNKLNELTHQMDKNCLATLSFAYQVDVGIYLDQLSFLIYNGSSSSFHCLLPHPRYFASLDVPWSSL